MANDTTRNIRTGFDGSGGAGVAVIRDSTQRGDGPVLFGARCLKGNCSE